MNRDFADSGIRSMLVQAKLVFGAGQLSVLQRSLAIGKSYGVPQSQAGTATRSQRFNAENTNDSLHGKGKKRANSLGILRVNHPHPVNGSFQKS